MGTNQFKIVCRTVKLLRFHWFGFSRLITFSVYTNVTCVECPKPRVYLFILIITTTVIDYQVFCSLIMSSMPATDVRIKFAVWSLLFVIHIRQHYLYVLSQLTKILWRSSIHDSYSALLEYTKTYCFHLHPRTR